MRQTFRHRWLASRSAASLREGWDHFWFRTGPPHLLALFRIVFGAFLLLYFGLQLPHVALLYSWEGIHLPLFSSPLFAAPPLGTAYVLFLTFYTALFCFTIGLLTRVSAAVFFILYSYYWVLSLFQFGTSFDRLFLFTTLVLVFSGCGKTFSVDMKLKHGSFFDWEPISILSQRLLAVQITATYLGVGWQKLMLPAWQTGKVLSYSFIGRWATPLAFWIAQLNLPLPIYDAMTWLVKVFEISIPFGLWIRRTRIWFILGSAVFHISISALLAIWWFLPLIPACMLFYEPEALFPKTRKPKSAILS